MAKLVDVISASMLGVRSMQENPDGSSFIDSSATWQNLLALPKFTDPIGLLPPWERGWPTSAQT